MQRRTFLATATTGAIASTTGCLGYTVQKQEDVKSRKNEVDKLESEVEAKQETIQAQKETVQAQKETISSQESELEKRKQRISELNDRIDQLEQDKSALESDVDQLKREKVSNLYEAAHLQYQSAGDDFDAGKRAESDGDLELAIGWFGIAYGKYQAARDTTEQALKLAKELGADPAVSRLDESRAAFDLYADASASFANENLFRSRGDDSAADDAEQQANDEHDQAKQKTVYTPDEIRSALGL